MSDEGIYEVLGKPIERYAYKLAHACEWLHGSTFGSGESMPPRQALTVYFFLQARLKNWQAS